MPVLQFAGQSYQARSTQLIAQQCINAFVETTPKDAKSQVPIYGTAGLTDFACMGDGPINGMWIMAGNLYVVSAGALFELLASSVAIGAFGTLTATPTLIGQTSLGGILSMADNGQQLIMVDGFGGWIYQPGGLNQVTTATAAAGATSVAVNQTGTLVAGDAITITLDTGQAFPTTIATTSLPASGMIFWTDPLPSQASAGAIIIDPSVVLARITAVAFMAANVVTYMDGYFVFNAAGTRQFFLSGINDGTQYSGLDFATATANTGFVLAVVNFHEQLLIFTSKASTEVWYDSGASAFPFQRYDGAYLQRGIAAPLAQCSEDNTVFWMADDGIAYRLNGFLPQRISTFAMEHAWAQYPQRYLDCFMFVLDQEGHKFVICQFPSGQQTWVYDISTQLWHQRESWGSPWISCAVITPTITYCTSPIVMTTPTEIETASNLSTLPATYSTAVLSTWVLAPDDTIEHGMIFSNQTDDTHGTPNGGIFVQIANDQTATPQIAVMAWDASRTIIVSATYDYTSWSGWVNVLVSIDTATQVLQVYANDAPLTPASITWTSSNPIANPTGQRWHVIPVA